MARPLGITGQLGPRTTFEEHRARSRTSVLGVRQHFCWQMDVNAVFCPGFRRFLPWCRHHSFAQDTRSCDYRPFQMKVYEHRQIHVRIISMHNICEMRYEIPKMNCSRYDMWIYVACGDICTEHNYSNSLSFYVVVAMQHSPKGSIHPTLLSQSPTI